MVTVPGPLEEKVLKKNPWLGTGFAKDPLVLADTVPWDKQKQGQKALSENQKRQNRRLAKASRDASKACSGTRGKAKMACRAKYIRERLSQED